MESKNIILHLPWPPSVNNYYYHNKYGQYISKKGRLYREKVEEYVIEQSIKQKSIDYSICLKIILFPPDKKLRDLDNYNKSLLDALSISGLWKDDSLIDQLFIFRGAIIPKGKIIIVISEGRMIIPVNCEHIIEDL